MKHRYGDQYARLEAVRSYIQMAGSIAAEFRKCESFASETPINEDHISELQADIEAASYAVQSLIDDIAAEAAIEGAEKDTMLPPPMNPSELDEPFHQESEQ